MQFIILKFVIAEMIAHHEVLSAEAQNTSYSAATASCKEIRSHLETSGLPQHKLVQVILYIIC